MALGQHIGTSNVKFDYKPPFLARAAFPGNARSFEILGPAPDDHIVKTIQSTESFYEIELLLHLALRGPLGGIFVDAGSNIGNHALFFAAFLADHVICVEPMKVVADLCRANFSRNQLTNYQLSEKALGARKGQGHLAVISKDNLGQTQFIAEKKEGAQTLEMITLDSLYKTGKEQHPHVPWNLIKIDVEGMQLDVIKGADELLSKERPQIVVEAETQSEFEDIRHALEPKGYLLIGRFCETATYHFLHPEQHKLRPLPILYQVARTLRQSLRSK